MNAVVHIAGMDVEIGTSAGRRLRQRCSWCGAVLADHDLAKVAVPVGQDPRPPIWPVGALVGVDGPASWLVDHTDGQPLPKGACALIDPEVTV